MARLLKLRDRGRAAKLKAGNASPPRAKPPAAASKAAKLLAHQGSGSGRAGPTQGAVAAGLERGEVAAKLLELRGGSGGYRPGLGSRIGLLYGGDGFGAAGMESENARRAVTVVTNEACAFLTVQREFYLRALKETEQQAVWRSVVGGLVWLSPASPLHACRARQMDEVFSVLQSARLFKDCPEAEVRALVRGAQRQRCLSGKVIAMEGDVLPGVFFVHRGRCTVYKNLAPPHHPHGSGLARPDTRHSLRSTRGRSHATAGSGKAPSPKLQPEAAVGMSVLQRMADAREASAAGANGQDSQVRCVGERRRRAQRGAHATLRVGRRSFPGDEQHGGGAASCA